MPDAERTINMGKQISPAVAVVAIIIVVIVIAAIGFFFLRGSGGSDEEAVPLEELPTPDEQPPVEGTGQPYGAGGAAPAPPADQPGLGQPGLDQPGLDQPGLK